MRSSNILRFAVFESFFFPFFFLFSALLRGSVGRAEKKRKEKKRKGKERDGMEGNSISFSFWDGAGLVALCWERSEMVVKLVYEV
jgi:hypothetical protein